MSRSLIPMLPAVHIALLLGLLSSSIHDTKEQDRLPWTVHGLTVLQVASLVKGSGKHSVCNFVTMHGSISCPEHT